VTFDRYIWILFAENPQLLSNGPEDLIDQEIRSLG
jgi:hypothetical protein